jgi:hypothetical protein
LPSDAEPVAALCAPTPPYSGFHATFGLSSGLDFDETNDEWTYEGPTVGAYATYLDDAFHADLTVKGGLPRYRDRAGSWR